MLFMLTKVFECSTFRLIFDRLKMFCLCLYAARSRHGKHISWQDIHPYDRVPCSTVSILSKFLVFYFQIWKYYMDQFFAFPQKVITLYTVVETQIYAPCNARTVPCKHVYFFVPGSGGTKSRSLHVANTQRKIRY